MRRLLSVFGMGGLALGVFCLMQPVGLAQAELYVAGQVGANLPSSYSNVEWSAGGPSASGNNLSLENSVMYGGKIGYYFDSLKIGGFNLGIETEAYSAKANIKNQNVTIGGVAVGSLGEISNRVTTWAPINIVVRYQAGMLEPYAGVGVGVFFSSLSTGNITDTSTDVGVNTQLGLRFRVTNNFALFGEWKFNHASGVSHTLPNTGGLNVSADYNANVLAFGAAFHF
jgi:outer membrane protein W